MNKVLLSLLGIAGAVFAICFFSYVSANNAGNAAEKGIEAAYTDNQNVLAQYGQKIQEAAQIPAMQRDDLLALFTGSIKARYGANGSQANMQWIREQNPNLSQDTYKQLMQMIEAGRNEFRVAQTKLIDRIRNYKTELGSFWRGMWLKNAGYPSADFDFARYKIITTDYAANAFESGKEASPIKLR